MLFTPTIEPRKVKFSQLKIGQRYKEHLSNNSYNRILRISKKGKHVIRNTMDYEQDDHGIQVSHYMRGRTYDYEVYILEE